MKIRKKLLLTSLKVFWYRIMFFLLRKVLSSYQNASSLPRIGDLSLKFESQVSSICYPLSSLSGVSE